MPQLIEAAMGACRNAFGIFLPGFDIVKIHIVRVDIHDPFPAAIGPSVRMFQTRSRLLAHRPTRRLDDGKSDCATAARRPGGNGYILSSVTGGVGDCRVAATAWAQAAAPTRDRPGGGARIYRERYFFTDPDTSPGTIGGRRGHSLRSDGARGAAGGA